MSVRVGRVVGLIFLLAFAASALAAAPALAGTAEEISELSTRDSLSRVESPLSNSGKWSALAWVSSGSAQVTGTDTTNGWGPAETPAVSGAYWSPFTFADAKGGVAASIAMQAGPAKVGGYLSVWIDMPDPGSVKSGYELRSTLNSDFSTYAVKLVRWSSGNEAVLASQAEVPLGAGTTLAISDTGGTVTAWKGTGGSLTSLIFASDSAYGVGSAGIEASGDSIRATGFAAGPLIGGAVAGAPLLDNFGRSENPLATGKFSKTAWTSAIGAVWNGSWHGYGTNSAGNQSGVYWNQTSFDDSGGTVLSAATIGTASWPAGQYASLWLDMPSPGSTRSGYEARLSGTGTQNIYKVELSKWNAGTRIVLASKENVSIPVGTTVALTESSGGRLGIWFGAGSSFSLAVAATDTAYSSGYAGIEVLGGNGTYYDFKAGAPDLQSPNTIISSGPRGYVTYQASFSSVSTEAGSTFECSIDGFSFAPCGSPITYTSLSEGAHTVRIRAKDAAGNLDPTPAECSFQVLSTDKFVAGAPLLDNFGRSENPLATGKFSKTAWTSAIGAVWNGSWHGYGTNSAGNQSGVYWNQTSFDDSGGTVLSAATIGTASWPAGQYASLWLDMPSPGSTRSGYEARLSGTGTQNIYKVELSKWNAGTRIVLASKENVSIPVGTTVALTESSGGRLGIWFGAGSSFSLAVAATDTAYSSGYAGIEVLGGNGTYYNFKAGAPDLQAPETTITSGPSGEALPDVSFSFESTEAGASLECSLDASAFVSCASPKEYESLSDGSHTFRVRAVDAVGNQDPTPAERIIKVSQTIAEKTSATTSFNDIACSSTTKCIAVGESDGSGTTQIQSAAWNGSTWSRQATPVPDDAARSTLSGLSCPGASLCFGVGTVRDLDNIPHALVLTRDGTWSVRSVDEPSGAKASQLRDVDCTSKTECTAVGSYEDSSGSMRTLVVVLSGSSWSPVASPNVTGAKANELFGISCTSASSCTAVGSFVDSEGTTQPLAMRWDRTSWSLTTVPVPSSATFGILASVWCEPGECKAVGNYLTETGVQRSLVTSWSGSSWTGMTVEEPATAKTSKLEAISCTSASACSAVGSFDDGADDRPLAMRWNGTVWKAQPVDISSTGALGSNLKSVDCVLPNFCQAVGSIVYGHAASERNLAFKYDGTSWALTEAGNYERVWLESSPSQTLPGDDMGLSCVSASWCIRVGTYQRGTDVERPFAQRWTGSGWSAQYLPSPAGARSVALNDVSCRSTSDCLAVGTYLNGEGGERPLSLKWNGSAWSILSTPMPDDAILSSGAGSADLETVSCVSGLCAATGQYVSSAGATQGLAMTWDGTTWSVGSVPTPSGGSAVMLAGVSCASSTMCMAVGHVTEDEALRTIALSWNGTTWAAVSLPAEPSGTTASVLSSVSCAEPSFCVAVGGFWDSYGIVHGLAERWSGGTWVRESTPSPDGSRWTSESNVYCASAKACVTVGLYAEESGRRQALASAWDGIGWSPVELSAPERNSESNLSEVSCAAEAGCMAIGDYVDTLGVRRLLSTSWTNKRWAGASGPEPSGASSATLFDAACIGPARCVAVGRSTSSGVTSGLAAMGSPGSWEVTGLPSPPGSSASELTGVGCPTATSCTAVGSYTASGAKRPLAMAWDGTAWSILSTPLPKGASAAELAGIACTSPGYCVAVGSYTAAGVEKNLAMSWNGTSWSVVATPIPSGATASKLAAVSCASTTFCSAVGEYTQSGAKNEAITWNGTSWSIVTVPNPSGSIGSALTGVVCLSSTSCSAVGYYTVSGGLRRTNALVWKGSLWTTVNTPPPIFSDELRDVTCTSSTNCTAVGQATVPFEETPLFQIVLNWNGSAWTAAETTLPAEVTSGLQGVACSGQGVAPTSCVAVGRLDKEGTKTVTMHWSVETASKGPSSGLEGISCLREACMAVGRLETEPADRAEVAWQLRDSGWQALPTPSVREGALRDVSCTTTTACTAVGGQSSGLLVERWDGAGWTVQAAPNPTGSAISLAGVACASGSSCGAVGQYTSSGQSRPLVEAWAGAAWSIQSVPLPGGATAGWLEDIACPATNSCVAVGTYKDGSGVRHGLTERWNGSAWTATALNDPIEGASTELTAVFCASSSSCRAVGQYSRSGETLALASSWDGSTWVDELPPNDPAAAASYLNDIFCYAAQRCVAVGRTLPKAGSGYSNLSLGWNGTSWSLEGAPNRETSSEIPASMLNAISCSAAADCVSVGAAADAGQQFEFALDTPDRSATPPPITEEKTLPEALLQLSETQREDASALIEADPDFQSVVQGDNFEMTVGAWTETNSSQETSLVGATATVAMITPHDWDTRLWPTLVYEDGDPSYYLHGSYGKNEMRAGTEEVTTLLVGLDAEIDSNGNFIDGEIVRLEPILGEAGSIIPAEEAEEEEEEDPNAWEY